MAGFKNKLACRRLMAGKLLYKGECHRNVIVSRCDGILKFSSFETEIHSTPYFSLVVISDDGGSITARDGNQSIIIDM